jgi:hypothetical protein
MTKPITDADLDALDMTFELGLIDSVDMTQYWPGIRERIRLADTLLEMLLDGSHPGISPELEAAWQQWEISRALVGKP